MSLLDSFVSKFIPSPSIIPPTEIDKPKTEKPKPETENQNDICGMCGERQHWQPMNSTRWLCCNCSKPPTVSIVARTRRNGVIRERPESNDAGSVERVLEANSERVAMVSQEWINAGAPICHECLGQVYVETVWSDETVERKCWSCRTGKTKYDSNIFRDVTDDRKPELLAERRAERARKREALMNEV